MIGVVVASHGKLAEELLHTAETVVGPLPEVRPVNVVASDPEVRHKIEEAIRAVDAGEGVLLLTDLLGGSPTQLCLSFLNERKVEVVTGVNLPMLVKLSTCRAENATLRDTAQMLAGYGQKNITLASELLRTRARTNRN
jgi:mannose PTS system EIIA component